MRYLALILALGLGGPAMATTTSGPTISPDDVIAVVTHDWNEDGRADRAVLAANEDAADLYIYLSADTPADRNLAVHAPGIVWRGALAGRVPELALAENGSLQVLSMNESIGRDRWRETLTIALRNGIFSVAGFTYIAYDTLNLDQQMTCDINLFNGQGVVNDRPVRSVVRARPADQWSIDTRPDINLLCPEG